MHLHKLGFITELHVTVDRVVVDSSIIAFVCSKLDYVLLIWKSNYNHHSNMFVTIPKMIFKMFILPTEYVVQNFSQTLLLNLEKDN